MENDTSALQGPGVGQRRDLMPKPDMDRATTSSPQTLSAPLLRGQYSHRNSCLPDFPHTLYVQFFNASQTEKKIQTSPSRPGASSPSWKDVSPSLQIMG